MQVVNVYSTFPHNHEYGPTPGRSHTFLYVADGRAQYLLGATDQTEQVRRGHLLWLPITALRWMRTGHEGLHQCAIRFLAHATEDPLGRLSADLPPWSHMVDVSNRAQMEQLFKKAERLWQRNFDPYVAWDLRAILCQVLARFLEAMQQDNSPHLHRQVSTVKAYLADHLAKPDLRLAELAALCGWSPSYLIQAFRSVVGETPMAYLHNLRMNRSIELLSTGEFTVGQVASHCGFNDPAYFSRAFAKHVGKPPSTYIPR